MNPSKQNILYKYRDWTNINHKKLLFLRELYIASPKDFNDPFDCRITQNFSLLDTEEKIQSYVKRVVEKNRDKLYKEGQNIPQYEKRIYERLKYHNKEEQNKWDAYTFRKQDEFYGIVSLSKIWDSVLMWGHYSHHHTGFCVGFYENKLIEINTFGKGGPVIYNDNFPNINPENEMTFETSFIATHTKAKDWEYEEEYRFFKLFKSNPGSAQDRTTILDKSCFAEIIIGVNFPRNDIREIFDVAYELGIPIYQAKQLPFSFKLIREQLI